MLRIHRDREIHVEDEGWFDARWHFSFGRHHHPAQIGLGALRAFNDDRIVPGSDWPMHPHAGMESLTCLLAGHVTHADSLGNGGGLETGAPVMTMSDEGAEHAETNGSDTEPMRFPQFWILPSTSLANAFQQRQFNRAERADRWLQIMGPPGENGLDLAQDAHVRVTRAPSVRSLDHVLAGDRLGHVDVIDGQATLDGNELTTGDAATMYGSHELRAEAAATSELMLSETLADFEQVGVWDQ